MIWILLIPALLALAGLVLAGVGTRLPREPEAARKARFECGPAEHFAKVRRSHSKDARGGRLTFAVIAEELKRKLVVQIADARQMFGGTWKFEFTPEGASTHLRITERGFVSPPLFRFLTRFVFGYTGSIGRRLRELGAAEITW